MAVTAPARVGTHALRPARTTDIPGIIDLFAEWHWENTCRGLEIPTSEAVRERLPLTMVAVDPDGTPIGLINGRLSTAAEDLAAVFPPGSQVMEIEHLYVARGHRNEGVGTALLQALIARGQETGAAGYWLSTAVRDWEHAVRFYQRHGFEVWAVRMVRPGLAADRAESVK